MENLNRKYRQEAQEIAAHLIDSDGYHWLAGQIRKGLQPQRREVRIAMLALMVARGEFKMPYR